LANRFSELYDYCQTLTPKVSRNSIKGKVKEMFEEIPRCIKTSMDIEVSRGFFISSKNEQSDFVRQVGHKDVIILARGLNRCWERFVYVKELMHVFDNPDEYVDSSEKLGKLLNSFEIPPTVINDNAPFESEAIAFWRALSCLCPEKNRQEFLVALQKGHIDNYGIALKLRIPQQHVPYLLNERYLEIIEQIKNQ
jgi:hypothetical protein